LGKVIVFCSSIGGTGKTTLSTQISKCLNKRGKTVLLIETDPFRPLGVLLKRGEEAVYDLYDLISNNCELSQAIVSVNEGFDMIIGPSDYLDEGLYDGFGKLVSDLCQGYDFVIIDRPSGCDLKLESYLPQYTALVTHLNEPISLSSAEKVAQKLKKIGNAQGKIIINKFSAKTEKKHPLCNVDDITDKTTLQLLGVVPLDEAVCTARIEGCIPSKGRCVDACQRITERLLNEPTPLPNLKKI